MLFEDLQAILAGDDRTNRIQLTLSARAYRTLQQDRQDFSLPTEPPDKPLPLSKLVNHVVLQYHRQAQSSIALQLHQREADLQRILSGLDEPNRRAATRRLLEAYRAELEANRDKLWETLRQAAGAGQAETSFLIRLSKPAMEALQDHFSGSGLFDENRYYESNIGRYLKFLLEEYARLNNPQREALFYLPWLDPDQGLLPKAIASGQELLLSSRRGAPGSPWVFRPYAVRLDEETLYHYLVGYLAGEEGWVPCSLRVNLLHKIRPGAVRRPLTKAEQQTLQHLMAQKGVAYLAGAAPAPVILVQLTPEGEQLYRRIRHMRPPCLTPPGPDGVYAFGCSAFQAKNYFLRFGGNARILEPASLRQELADFFRQGLDANREGGPDAALPQQKEETL